MAAGIYPVLRDMQSRFGGLLETKANMQRAIRQFLKRPFEDEFRILGQMDIGEGLCLDIGGNRGQSIDAIRLMQPDSQIVSIEPSHVLATALAHRSTNDKNISIMNMGLGDTPGSFTLYTPYYRNFMYDGLASFSEAEAREWLNADTVWRFNPDLLRLREDVCDIKTLDELNLDPVFIKLDVQGFEQQVLAGGRETLTRCKPLILMENNDAGDEFLNQLGWQRAAYGKSGLSFGAFGDNNTLYLSDESLAYAGLVRQS